MGAVLNAGIKAVRDITAKQQSKQSILHVADPKNVEWWFDNIIRAQHWLLILIWLVFVLSIVAYYCWCE